MNYAFMFHFERTTERFLCKKRKLLNKLKEKKKDREIKIFRIQLEFQPLVRMVHNQKF
jgi:hypothetical protein